MKTLIFNGSPRKNGDTDALIGEYLKHLAGEVEIIKSFGSGISPCTDCRSCCKNIGCIIKDDMQRVYHLADECDVAVIASPINFSLPTGTLLNLFSRFQSYYCNEKFLGVKHELKPKRGVILLAGGGDGSPEPAITASKTMLRCIGVKGEIAVVLSDKTDELAAKDDIKAHDEIKNIAAKIYGE